MMFGAGMGIGLLFWSVSEPLAHFADPPSGTGGTAAAAERAMRLTFFHWGLHAWAVYAAVGLALAYFGYRRGLPLTIRSMLFPVIVAVLLAAVLLLGGGLTVLQTAAILAGLPFTFVLLLVCAGVWRALSLEGRKGGHGPPERP